MNPRTPKEAGDLGVLEASRGGLSNKLLEVMKAITRVEKRGENTFHNYRYATESDLVDAVRGELSSRGIRTRFNLVSTARVAKGDKGGFITDIEVDWQFVDTESGEVETSRVPGSGEDKGDKGVYKALTGSEKYWLMKTFLIPTGDDPEKDENEQGAAKRPNGTPGRAPMPQPPTPRPTIVRMSQQPPAVEDTKHHVKIDKVKFNEEDKSYWMMAGNRFFWTKDKFLGALMTSLEGEQVVVTGKVSDKNPHLFQLETLAKDGDK